MRNILLEISYNGKEYHGWQVQLNAVTVQEKLQDAIESVFGEREDIKGCSRTDAGVHANTFCCNFKTDKSIAVEKIPAALNANLPNDISVKTCKEMPVDFHARYDCKGKEYVYRIWNGKSRNPFLDKLCYFYKYNIDVELINNEAKSFIGKYDFSAFCASGSSVEDKVREIYSFEVKRNGEEVLFIVKGNGFLYNMVRIMVGTLLDISSGKIRTGTINEIIESRDRSRSGFTAPAEGLYLNSVYY